MSEELIKLYADSDYELNDEDNVAVGNNVAVDVLQELQNKLITNEKNNKKLFQKIDECDIMGYTLLKQTKTLQELLSIRPQVLFTFPICSFVVFVLMFFVYIYIGYLTTNR